MARSVSLYTADIDHEVLYTAAWSTGCATVRSSMNTYSPNAVLYLEASAVYSVIVPMFILVVHVLLKLLRLQSQCRTYLIARGVTSSLSAWAC